MTKRKVAWLAPLLVLSLVGSPAWAQDGAAAQVLFDQGRALVNEEKFAEACEKFAESQRLGPSSGTLLNLGECYAKLGKSASAWASFKEAIGLAHSANQADREKYANERLAQIEGSLVKLAITVPDEVIVPGFVLRRDGVELGKPAWGITIPVDPGPHVIEASAPRKKPWRTTVQIGAETIQEVVVPALVDDVPPVTASFFTQRRIGLGVGAVGVVFAGIGTIFGLGAISSNDSALPHCRTDDLCYADGLALKDSARGKADLSTVFFLLGGAAMGGGAILFFTAPNDADKSKAATRVRLAPAVSPSTAGVTVRGAWW